MMGVESHDTGRIADSRENIHSDEFGEEDDYSKYDGDDSAM